MTQEVHGGVPGFEPHVLYHAFGGFSINFTVVMHARECLGQYGAKHEFIKRLRERYGKEGIVRPFPIRTVYMKEKGL